MRMKQDEIYADFLTLAGMNAPMSTKCTMLGWLLKHAPNWIVIGVTPAALEKLAELDFRYEPRRGLERAHPYSRAKTYTRLLTELPSQAELWRILDKNDRTVLCDNSVPERENARIHQLPFCPVPIGLFEGKRVGWAHRVAERDFLRDLYARRNSAEMTTWDQLRV